MSEATQQRLQALTTVREVFATATEFEHTAHAFYTQLAPRVSKQIRWLVEELAREEAGHARLFTDLAHHPEVESILNEQLERPVSDGRFSDAVHSPDLGPEPDDQAVLQYALMREHTAMQQYQALATATPAGPLRDAFRLLAQEETQHKRELERLYYEVVHSGGV